MGEATAGVSLMWTSPGPHFCHILLEFKGSRLSYAVSSEVPDFWARRPGNARRGLRQGWHAGLARASSLARAEGNRAVGR